MINYSLFVELCDLVEKYKDRYEESKRSHIEKVITNGKKLFYSGMFPTLPDLFLSELESHDNTKFYSDEYFGAVLRHAVNFCGAKYPSKEIEDFANRSIDTHKKLNSHHPESFINPNDMTLMHLALMISDWEAEQDIKVGRHAILRDLKTKKQITVYIKENLDEATQEKRS